METIRKKMTITLWYFKPSGKFYTEHQWETECRVTDGSVLMQDLVAKLRGLNGSGQGVMPGLCSESWDGYAVINHEDGYPCLVKLEGCK